MSTLIPGTERQGSSKDVAFDLIDDALTGGLNWIQAYDSDVSDLSSSTEESIALARHAHHKAIDALATLRSSDEIAQLRAQLGDWLKANGPGGWIDDLRKRGSHETCEPREAALQRAIDRHVRWRETALTFLRQVIDGRGTEDEWPALAKFIERSDSRMVESTSQKASDQRTAAEEWENAKAVMSGEMPPCECTLRDKAPSAYHNAKCPRYVADKL